MTSNTQRIRNTAHAMLNEGFCLEGCLLETWLDHRAPCAAIDAMPAEYVLRFILGVNAALSEDSALETRRRINGLINCYFNDAALFNAATTA